MGNPVEVWKSEKHGLDVWPDVLRYAAAGTPMKDIDQADLERMKWHGFYYRKRDEPGRYMNRIRITANEVAADQVREIAHLAYEFGHGIIDVTTRAALQVQGLEIVNLPRVTERLEKVGLSARQTGHDNVRNVFAHPFSGLMPDELFDTRELCRAITEFVVGSREYSDLPRKFNICLNGTDEHSAHFWTQDISFLALKTHEGEVAFQAVAGGTQGQNPMLARALPVLIRPEQIVAVTRSLLDLFRKKASREERGKCRFRFLVEEIGISGVLEWLEADLPFRLTPFIREPLPAGQNDDFIGWFPQKQPGLWTMGLSIPLGRLTWMQLEGLAILSKRWGDGQLRTTHEQGLAVINIPTGFRNAAATDAAALGLSVHADPLERNTVACTGAQFCNIAVTETKGHMFQLMERLRQRGVMLHDIRIHMSGCPSSCAQHFTADIGLKGVRVRRLLGTREGFDVSLGGGVAGQVHMGLPYRLGVDVDQLPQLIEEVVREYYLRHRAGQTFSAYWREKLREQNAAKVTDSEYHFPVWICEKCEHRHEGEDPPVFCPSCAGLRRYFARLEDSAATADTMTAPDDAVSDASPVVRADGFVVVAKFADIPETSGLKVEAQGKTLALFREGDAVRAIDDACPHEGASLSEGDFKDGVVSCPWHAWTFNTCSGCSLDPAGHKVAPYETRVEDGQVLMKLTEAGTGSVAGHGSEGRQTQSAATGDAPGRPSPADILAAIRKPAAAKPGSSRPAVEATLKVLAVIHETPDVRTFRLDNSQGLIPFDLPGKFLKVKAVIDGRDVWRNFTVSSSPSSPERLDLTIKLNPAGELTPWLFSSMESGSDLTVKGAQGGYFLDPAKHPEPLLLISAGSGITPMMSIVRFLLETKQMRPVVFLHGARMAADIIFAEECQRLAASIPEFRYAVSLTQPGPDWTGATGRLEMSHLQAVVGDVSAYRAFLCGPNEFMESFRAGLIAAGLPGERIHTEQFHKAKTPAAVS